jgi:hypothetical protein
LGRFPLLFSHVLGCQESRAGVDEDAGSARIFMKLEVLLINDGEDIRGSSSLPCPEQVTELAQWCSSVWACHKGLDVAAKSTADLALLGHCGDLGWSSTYQQWELK